MIYDVRQTATYTYGAKVGYARHVLRLTPVDRAPSTLHVAVPGQGVGAFEPRRILLLHGAQIAADIGRRQPDAAQA